MTTLFYIAIVLSLGALMVILLINQHWRRYAAIHEDAPEQTKLRRRQRFATVLHVLTLFFLVLAMVEFGKKQPAVSKRSEDTAGVVFLLDVSQSMQDEQTQEWCQRQINQLYDQVEGRASLAGIAFGGQSELLFAAGDRPAFGYNQNQIQVGATDIQQALNKAGNALVLAKHKKIVLFTDGKTSTGDALKEAYLLAENEVEIYPVLPPGYAEKQSEVETDSGAHTLRLPSYVNAGEPFAVELMLPQPLLASEYGRTVKSTILVDGQRQPSHDLKLDREKDYLTQTLQLKEPGIHHIQFELNTEPALIYEGYVTLLEPARVLLLESYNSGLAKVLYERNFTVDVLRKNECYLSPEDLAPYNLVFLNDMPPEALLEDTELNLLDFVQEKGGGLVYNMGPLSAKPNFKERALYPLLPMKPDEAPDDGTRISLCIAIDNSGSMQLRGLDKAAKSLIRSRDNMEKVKRLSIFTFDTREQWLTAPKPETYQVADIIDRLEAVQSGGGGINVHPAMQIAYESVRNAPYNRHVLLITDLDDSQLIVNSAAMAADAYRRFEIKTHVLAIGDYGRFRYPLQEMAKQGNGSYKELRKAGNTIAQLNWDGKGDESIAFQDEPVKLGLNQQSPIVNGIPGTLPEGRGYVPMLTKEGAVEVLQVSTGEKSLAALSHWIQGKGRVAMLNAGIENPEGWYDWPYLDKFWSQLMRWSAPLNTADPYLVEVEPGKESVWLHFRKSDPRQSVPAPASVRVKDLEEEFKVPLTKHKEGHFFARFVPTSAGFYTIDLLDESGYTLLSHRAYFPKAATSNTPVLEQLDFSANVVLLEAIAGVSGGEMNPEVISFEESTTVASSLQKVPQKWSGYWQLFLLLALLTFGLGVYIRNGLSWKAVRASYPRMLALISGRNKN